MNLDLKGKKALVTGGTHGIGKAIALGLASEGCDVAVFSRTEARVQETQRALGSTGTDSIALVADVLDPKSYSRVRGQIKDKWGGVDIVVNNIGGGGRWGKENLLETDDVVWEEVYNKNLTAAMRYTKMFLPHMLENNWGRVVTITSIYGRQAGGRPWFNIAKTAQTTLMKNLATNRQYASSNITFNSVAPGGIWIPDTGWEDMRKKDPRGFEELVRERFPRGRMGTPEEVANLVLFLCSSCASLISGASIAVDGGESVYF
jgi:3-oxoacyl-[acyl-carrier protein] reductase|tara:strand:+ start:12824 stop:13606 length:783 start_codon:yes stop_codon:yes gene_type:complete